MSSRSTTCELTAAMEEQLGATLERAGRGGTLEGPHGRRADRHHPVGAAAQAVQVDAGTRYHSLCMRWSRGSRALTGWNVSSPTTSSTATRADPDRLDAADELGGEVETGGGCRGRGRARWRRRSGSARGRRAGADVGRQGDLAVRRRAARSGRRHSSTRNVSPAGGARPDHDQRSSVGRRQHVTRAQPAGRADQRLPAPSSAVTGSSRSTSAAPPVARRNRSRAGITLLSLTTTTSPSCRRSGSSAT